MTIMFILMKFLNTPNNLNWMGHIGVRAPAAGRDTAGAFESDSGYTS